MLARATALRGRLARRLALAGGARAEGGFVLMEAVVSAALLAVVAIGVLAALDSAAASSARQKSRSAAAQLAEGDQERLRSMRVVDLSNHGTRTRSATLRGVRYTVTSQARWVRDATGAETCTAGAQGDYIRITSSVSSSVVGAATRPVTMESIVAPPVATFGPGQGTLAVKVTDRDDRPLPNLTTAIGGPGSYSDLTNSVGCALFGYVPVGTYDVTLDRTGWVDHSGDNLSTAQVTEGQVNVQPVQFDSAAAIDATFIARFRSSAGVLGDYAVSAPSITAANGDVPGGLRSFPSATGQQASLSATSLFPFHAGYTVFTGQCADADPTRFDSAYFTTSGNPGFSNVTPGERAAVVVRQGSLDLTVERQTGPSTWVPAGAGLVVRVTPTGTGCGTATTWTTDGSSRVTKPPTASFPFDPSLPYGRYDVCVHNPASGKRATLTVDVNSRDPRPASGTTIRPNTNGTCP